MKPISLFILLMCLTHPVASAQWQTQVSNTQADFRGLSVVNANIVWVSGSNGTYACTNDGGQHWAVGTVPNAAKLDFRDVEAVDKDTVYLLSAGPGTASRIYKTNDGGMTWNLQFKNSDPAAFYDAIAFWDAQHGIAFGDPVNERFQLLRTTDGGTHWKPLKPKQLPQALPGEAAFAASGTCLVTQGENDVWFATGGGKYARIFHSKDRGQHWEVSNTPLTAGTPTTGIFSIAFRDPHRGMIVGGNFRQPNATGATAAVTIDGGETWRRLNNRLPYCSAVAWAKDRWVAVGTSGSHVSIDDGATWQRLDDQDYNTVGFTAKGEGWAAGPKGRIAKFLR